MNYLTTIVLLAMVCASVAHADEINMMVPDGWTATESGIAKGNSTLTVGSTVDLDGLSLTEYLAKLALMPIEEMEITETDEPIDGEFIVSVKRELLRGDQKARSILFVCKDGRNRHRLLELYSDHVFTVISGTRAAIAFCSQE